MTTKLNQLKQQAPHHDTPDPPARTADLLGRSLCSLDLLLLRGGVDVLELAQDQLTLGQ